MSKNKQLSVSQQRRAAALHIAAGMCMQRTLAAALARYDASIEARKDTKQAIPPPTAVAHVLTTEYTPAWRHEFHVGMLRAPARDARKKARRAAASAPQTQAEANQAVLYGGGGAAYELPPRTLADVVDSEATGLDGYKRRTVKKWYDFVDQPAKKWYGFVDQWQVRGRDGQVAWAEVGKDLVVVYCPLRSSVTMRSSDREALAQWMLVRGGPAAESMHEGILSQIHDLLWDKENRIGYRDLPRVVRELKEKAQQWDKTRADVAEHRLETATESIRLGQWQALGQRWLDHYFDVAQRNPEARAGAKGAIAALKNLLRKEEPPNWTASLGAEGMQADETRVGSTPVLATPGMQADEQFVLFKTAPAGADGSAVRPRPSTGAEPLPSGAPKFVRVNNTLLHVDAIRRIDPHSEGSVRLSYEGGTFVIANGTVDEWADKLAARPR